MNGTSRLAFASDRERQMLELRVIVVSARAAHRETATPAQVDALRARTEDLLASLEERVLQDGGSRSVLVAIEDARRRLSSA